MEYEVGLVKSVTAWALRGSPASRAAGALGLPSIWLVNSQGTRAFANAAG